MCQRDEESRTRLLSFGEVLDLRGRVQREGLSELLGIPVVPSRMECARIANELADAHPGRQVVLLFGGATARDVYPSSLLPDEVEYVVATDDGSVGHHGFVTELVAEYEAWADQAFACGPLPMLRSLAGLAATRRRRMGVASLGRKRGAGRPIPAGSTQARRKAFLQVSMEQNMGCAVGACLGCVVMDAKGAPQRVCREGPVFASDELEWEGSWQ